MDWILGTNIKCPHCGLWGHVWWRSIEDDEGHEDYAYWCKAERCGHRWYVDGIDS